jgi:AbrB family looped-hinge helix DNA binding protein
MSEARMTSKGQITVPKDVRLKLNLKPGDRVLFIVENDGAVRMRAINKDISSLIGILPRPKRAATLEEIEAAIQRAAIESALGHDRD